MPQDDLWAAVEEHLDMIVSAYRRFENEKPIVLFDIREQRIYVYPYEAFRHELSIRSQALLTNQYREAVAANKIVVFVRDDDQRKLVSSSIDYE